MADRLPGEVPCGRCGAKARYLQRYSGKAFCGKCFTRDLRRRVHRDVKREGIIRDGESLLFAVSGGKDSVACLDMLYPFEVRRGVDMSVLTIDEGIQGYRPQGIEVSRRAARERDLEFHVASFREEFGAGIDDILARAGSASRACTYCGVLRRWLLNRRARELGGTVVVTGHNLDDEAESALLNLVRGDPVRICRSGPSYLLDHPRLVPRAKPLRRIPGRETLLYDLFCNLDVHLESCPYSGHDMRNVVRRFLNEVEEGRPTSKSSFLSTVDKLGKTLAGDYAGAKLRECGSCGEPTMGMQCKACKLLDSVGLL